MAVELCQTQQNRPRKEIAEELGITANMLNRWARIKNEKAPLKSQILSTEFSDGKVMSFSKENRQRLKINVNKGRLTKANLNNRGYNKYLKMYPEQEELYQIINENF